MFFIKIKGEKMLTCICVYVRSLGWKDSLEEGMATHFSTLAWRIPWTEEPGGLQSMGSQRVRHDRSDLAVDLRD